MMNYKPKFELNFSGDLSIVRKVILMCFLFTSYVNSLLYILTNPLNTSCLFDETIINSLLYTIFAPNSLV